MYGATGASCPVAIAVSCSADRQAKAKITKEGIVTGKNNLRKAWKHNDRVLVQVHVVAVGASIKLYMRTHATATYLFFGL